MATLDTILFGFFALLLTLKMLILATATMLLVFNLTKRVCGHRGKPRHDTPRAHRLDTHA